MKLGVKVKNVEQSSNLDFDVVGVLNHSPTHPTTLAKTTPYPSSANFGPIFMKFCAALKIGE